MSKRVTAICEMCGTERNISKEQVAKIEAGKARNICRGCARRLTGRYGNGGMVTCPDCGEQRKASARTLGRIANGEMTERCRSCAARKRMRDIGIRYGEKSLGWRGGKVNVSCTCCGKEIERHPSNISASGQIFCSRECYNTYRWGNMEKENHPRWKGGMKTVICEWCGCEFEIAPSHIEKGEGRFCSYKCHGKWKSKYLSGKNSAQWRGGISFEPYPPIFNRALKAVIRERDSHACILCGKYGSNVHHIDYDKDNCQMNNLITLCDSCHGKSNHNRISCTAILSDKVSDMSFAGFAGY